MNKLELTEALRNATDLTKQEARTVVDDFFDKVSDALAGGDRVELRGLCSFFVKQYEAYTGRNPKTGEKTEVGPKRLSVFKARVECIKIFPVLIQLIN
jgi:integration host factor subunit beta